MKVGRVALVLAMSGVLLIMIALYGCGNGRLSDGEELRREVPTTPGVSLHGKTGVLRRERVVRPLIKPGVLLFDDIFTAIPGCF